MEKPVIIRLAIMTIGVINTRTNVKELVHPYNWLCIHPAPYRGAKCYAQRLTVWHLLHLADRRSQCELTLNLRKIRTFEIVKVRYRELRMNPLLSMNII